MGPTIPCSPPNPKIVSNLISWPHNPFSTGVSFKVWSSDNLSTWTNVTNNADISDQNFVKYTFIRVTRSASSVWKYRPRDNPQCTSHPFPNAPEAVAAMPPPSRAEPPEKNPMHRRSNG